MTHLMELLNIIVRNVTMALINLEICPPGLHNLKNCPATQFYDQNCPTKVKTALLA